MYAYSKEHKLTSIIYDRAKDDLPPEWEKRFKKATLVSVHYGFIRDSVVDEMTSLFSDNGIAFFTVKGQNIAKFYPTPECRTMHDIDVVVDDREKAHSLLVDNEYNNLSQNDNWEYNYEKSDVRIELHDRLVYETDTKFESSTAFFNNCKKFVNNNKLDDSFHFVYVVDHLRKHFMNSGVGLRQFLDVALLIKNDTELKWDEIERYLSDIGLLPFSKIVFFYIDKWFGVKAPISATPVPDDTFEYYTERIFSNGVFGSANPDNKKFYAVNSVRNSKYKSLSMLKLALGRIFPSYKALIVSPYYAFLVGKPWLLPVAWIRRFIRGIKENRVEEGKKRISNSFVSIDAVSQREEMYKNWGLQ